MKMKSQNILKTKTNIEKFNTYKKAQNFSNNIGEYFDYRFTKFEGPGQLN